MKSSIRRGLVALTFFGLGAAYAQTVGPVTRHAGDRSAPILGTTPDMAACVSAVAATRQIGECRALVTPRIGQPLPVVEGWAWRGAGEEGQIMRSRPDMRLAYGIGDTWVTRQGETASPCTAAFFGFDPAPGKRKRCFVLLKNGVEPNPSTPTQVSASRTSGPAPLAVLFKVENTFNGVYDFDFGDPRSGTWGPSGLPENMQRGAALAAHVYETPGTYTATVEGQRVAITVTQWPAATTTCVSASSNWEGCPEGAARVTSLPSSYAGRRWLLRRGESFGFVQPQMTDSAFQVGAYGEGAKPNVQGVGTFKPVVGTDQFARDWTVMDLNIGARAVRIDASTNRFLLLRNDITAPPSSAQGAMVDIGTAAAYYQANGHPNLQWPRENFIVANTVRGAVNRNANNVVLMGWLFESAVMGNTMDSAFQHTMRIWAAKDAVIAHNALGGTHVPEGNGPGIRHALKLHSSGQQPYTQAISGSPLPATSRVVIANNRLGSTSFPGSWLTGIGPQNADAGTLEGLEDIVAENNVFVRGPRTVSEIQMRGRRMTARGNTRADGGTPSIVRNGSTYDPRLNAWDGPYYLQD